MAYKGRNLPSHFSEGFLHLSTVMIEATDHGNTRLILQLPAIEKTYDMKVGMTRLNLDAISWTGC